MNKEPKVCVLIQARKKSEQLQEKALINIEDAL